MEDDDLEALKLLGDIDAPLRAKAAQALSDCLRQLQLDEERPRFGKQIERLLPELLTSILRSRTGI